MEMTAETPVDYEALMAEFRRRDLERMIAEHGDTEVIRQAHAKSWDRNPPCPDCGSFNHFEC